MGWERCIETLRATMWCWRWRARWSWSIWASSPTSNTASPPCAAFSAPLTGFRQVLLLFVGCWCVLKDVFVDRNDSWREAFVSCGHLVDGDLFAWAYARISAQSRQQASSLVFGRRRCRSQSGSIFVSRLLFSYMIHFQGGSKQVVFRVSRLFQWMFGAGANWASNCRRFD